MFQHDTMKVNNAGAEPTHFQGLQSLVADDDVCLCFVHALKFIMASFRGRLCQSVLAMSSTAVIMTAGLVWLLLGGITCDAAYRCIDTLQESRDIADKQQTVSIRISGGPANCMQFCSGFP